MQLSLKDNCEIGLLKIYALEREDLATVCGLYPKRDSELQSVIELTFNFTVPL